MYNYSVFNFQGSESVLGFCHNPILYFGSPNDQLEKYITSMGKIQQAMQYFSVNNPASPEMAHVVSSTSPGDSF